MGKIFKSLFTLQFKKKETCEKFRKNIDKSILNCIKITTFLYLLASFTPLVMFLRHFDLFKILHFRFVSIMSFISTFVFLIFLIIVCATRNLKVIKVINILNFYFLFYVLMNFRFALFRVLKIDPLMYSFLVNLEMMVRLVVILLNIYDYFEYFLLNIATFVTLWTSYEITTLKEANYFSFLLNAFSITFAIFIVILVAYFFFKYKKIMFSSDFLMKNKSRRYKNIFDRINTGLISLKMKKFPILNLICWKN